MSNLKIIKIILNNSNKNIKNCKCQFKKLLNRIIIVRKVR